MRQPLSCTKHKRQNENQSGAAILRVSKQLHSEVAEVLYGESQFSFLSLAALGEFVNVIGAPRRHLRHLGIEGYFDTSTLVPGLLRLLEQAKGLRSLKLSIEITK